MTEQLIYFDINKNAYNYPKEGYIATCTLNQWQYYSMPENMDKWDIVNGAFVDIQVTEEYIAKKEAEEQARIDGLTMTALDFIGFLQTCGLTLEQINTYLDANLAVKMQLTYCQNVYCNVAKSLMPITFGEITITSDMVERAFRIKHGEVLPEEPINEIVGNNDEEIT